MKNFFNSLKESVTGLFGKSKTEDSNISPESKSNKAFDQQEFTQQIQQKIKSLKLKDRLKSINSNQEKVAFINSLACDLSYRQIMQLRKIVTINRRSQMRSNIVQYGRLICQYNLLKHELLEDYKINYTTQDQYKLEEMILAKVLKAECDRVLFSKEELRDHFDYIEKKEILMNYNIYQLKCQFDQNDLKVILKFLIMDDAFEKSNIDECDEQQFVHLFNDDPEVQKWVKYKHKAVFDMIINA